MERCTRLGDRELDTIIGRGHLPAIVSLSARKSRLSLIAKAATKGVQGVKEAVLALPKPSSEHVHTITSDKMQTATSHSLIHHAKGLNENTNGLIRKYFPKECDFTTITQKDIEGVMDKLNNRPRKCLDMKTPNQVFFGINPNAALAS